MRYGHFDGDNREYVIDDPRTPAPWANYLGSPAYGAIITQNAGGYSFVKSGAAGRILRYTFNQFDEPGRYLYLRDDETDDFWSASWRPVEKPLDGFKTVCRHGTGYTVINSAYQGIESSALYEVPLNAEHEVWRLDVKNTGSSPRSLSVFGYCEWTTDSFYEQDQVNLQYTQFITRTEFMGDYILQRINEFCDVGANGENGRERFFGLAGAPVVSYTGRRERFLGGGRFSAPQAVREGRCDNSLNYGGNPCGALHAALTLKPGESRTLVFLLAQKGQAEARTLLERYQSPARAAEEDLDGIKTYWHGKLSGLTVHTPDEAFNQMVNTWNAYQCFITFVWSRAASLFYCGQRNGYGYRDTVQDIQGILHLDPAMAKERLTFMLSAQVSHGGGLPLVKFTHDPGHEDTPEQESYVKATGHPHYRADDALWLFPTVYQYVAETGDRAYLRQVIPFANEGEGTVLEHLKRAIDFSLNHLGAHGLPAGLHADWNDCLRLGEKGESSFVAFQLYAAVKLMAELTADSAPWQAYRAELETLSNALKQKINSCFWEGDRYLRGFTEQGEKIGSAENHEASLWLNPQCWAVISGAASPEQAQAAMENVRHDLNTPFGLRLMTPAYRSQAFDGARMVLFEPGLKENGGIFCQPQGWAILAEALLKHGDRAYDYFRESCPAAYNDRAELREAEPYVHTQFIESPDTPQPGRAHVHWLTGTASTVMVGCVQGILGLRPTPDGLLLSPAIPAHWEGLTMDKRFRGKWLHITVDNRARRQGAPKAVLLNGREQPGGFIPADELAEENDILVVF